MQSLNFNEGYQEFAINDDPNRVIRFNPSDVGILKRFRKTSTFLDNLAKEFGQHEPDSAEEALEKLDNAVREQIDFIFDQPVSEVVFGNQSPMSTVNGQPLFERFLNAVIPVIQKTVQDEKNASQGRIEKYVKAAKGT